MTELSKHTTQTDQRHLRRRIATGFADLAADLCQLSAEMPTRERGDVIAGCVDDLRGIRKRVDVVLKELA